MCRVWETPEYSILNEMSPSNPSPQCSGNAAEKDAGRF